MLQGTCVQLLKNLQALLTDFTLPGASYSLSHGTKLNKGLRQEHIYVPAGAPWAIWWLYPWKETQASC